MTAVLSTRARVMRTTGDGLLPWAEGDIAPILERRSIDIDRAFAWIAEVSNDDIDWYGTRMSESSLLNFEADLIAGIAYQNGHDPMEYLGRSIDGYYHDAGDRRQTYGLFYTLPGLTLGRLSTDAFIAGVKGGVLVDASVGFWSDDIRCSVCGRGWLDCEHLPGVRATDAEEETYFWVHDAHLIEVSTVHDGATPGAAIVKAFDLAERGEIEPGTMRAIERRYRVTLPERRRYRGVSMTGEDMAVVEAAEEQETPIADLYDRALADGYVLVDQAAYRERLDWMATDTQIDDVTDPLNAIDRLIDEVRMLQATLEGLEADAAMGRIYRQHLIDDALAEGVRAYGATFDADRYRATLTVSDVAVIESMRDAWRDLADARFAPGRRTVEQDMTPAPVNGHAAYHR